MNLTQEELGIVEQVVFEFNTFSEEKKQWYVSVIQTNILEQPDSKYFFIWLELLDRLQNG